MPRFLKKGRFFILTVITVLTVLFIFINSLIPGDLVRKQSEAVSRYLDTSLLFGKGCFYPLPDVTVIAHFLEFAFLGFFIGNLTLLFRSEGRGRIFIGIFIGLSVAFLDESVQILSGRVPSVVDMWIDLFGFTSAFGPVCFIKSAIIKGRYKWLK